jgi:predicted dehydrogenase
MTSPVGVALLGCAHTTHAWSYARALTASPHARLVGVFDEVPALAEPIVHDFGTGYWSDAAELAESPDVSAVVVCSATMQHRKLVDLAAHRGLPVLCEKPIATTLDDAEAMVAACSKAGVQLQMAFVTRFLPLVRQAGAALQEGELGDLVAMVGANRGRPPLPPRYPEWITTPSMSGGGALMDHSVHLTDVMRHLSGQEVVKVAAEADSLLWSAGIDDVALMSLEFERGMVASVDPSWSVPADSPWDYDFSLRILGTRGSLVIDDLAGSLHLVSRRSPGGLRLVPFGVDVDAVMLEAFLESVRAGEAIPPVADGEDGLRALEVALAGYAAAKAHSPVTLAR